MICGKYLPAATSQQMLDAVTLGVFSEDGYWGVKQTSSRIFDFAMALAGDDEEKMQR